MTPTRYHGELDILCNGPKEQLTHLGPVGVELSGVSGVLQGLVVLAQLGVGSSPVTVEDVVGRVQAQGLCVQGHSL